MAQKLVLLHKNHPKLYFFLNALVNIFVKGIPFAIYIMLEGDIWQSYGGYAIKIAINVKIFFMTFIMGMIMYLLFLGIWQFIKLSFFNYKRVNIYVHILGIIIRLGRKNILKSGNREVIEALYSYDEYVDKRKERINRGKDRAFNRRREREKEKMQFAMKEFERKRRKAENARDSANAHYKRARSGGGIFTSVADEIESGNKNMKDANYYEVEAMREAQKIADIKERLERW